MTVLVVLGAMGIDGYAVGVISFLAVSIIGGTLFSRFLKRDIYVQRQRQQRQQQNVITKRRFRFAEVAGTRRGLPFFFLGTMLAVQSIDGNSSLGNISLIFQSGSFWAGAIIPIGLAICLILTGMVYGKKLNKMSLLTLPDFYYRRYGKSAEAIFSILMIMSFIVLVAGCFAAIGYIISSVFGIDFFWAVLIGAIIVMLYSYSGGLFSSAYTDILIIGVTVIAFLAAFVFFSSSSSFSFGGLEGLEELVGGQGQRQSGPMFINWGGLVAIGLGGIISLDFTERIFAAKDGKSVRRGAYVGAGITLLLVIPVSILGVIALHLLPNTNDPFSALPNLSLSSHLPFPIGVALLIGVLGASISTASGSVLAMSSVISRNIVQRDIVRGWLRKRAGLADKTLLMISRAFAAPIIAAAFLLGYLIPQPGVNLILAFDIVFAGAWAPLTLGLFWRKANAPAAITSLVVGSVLRLAMFFVGNVIIPPQYSGMGLETIIPPVVTVILFIIVALGTQNKHPGRHDVVEYVPPIADVIKGRDLRGYYIKRANAVARTTSPEEALIVGEDEQKEEIVGKEERETRIPKQIKYVIIFFYVGIAIGWLILRVTLGVDIPFYVVSSGSMVPNLNIHDLVIIKRINNDIDSTSFNNLKVGDIIVFKSLDTTSEGKNRIILHRIAEIYNDENGSRVIKTKGDANPQSFPKLDYPIQEEQYIGKVVYVVPHGGALRKFG